MKQERHNYNLAINTARFRQSRVTSREKKTKSFSGVYRHGWCVWPAYSLFFCRGIHQIHTNIFFSRKQNWWFDLKTKSSVSQILKMCWFTKEHYRGLDHPRILMFFTLNSSMQCKYVDSSLAKQPSCKKKKIPEKEGMRPKRGFFELLNTPLSLPINFQKKILIPMRVNEYLRHSKVQCFFQKLIKKFLPTFLYLQSFSTNK